MAMTPALAEATPVDVEPEAAPATDGATRRVRRRWALRASRQVAESVAVIWSVVTITFLVTRVFAPDPTALFLGVTGNGFATPAAAAAAKAQVQANLGLDTPILSQYVHFLNQVLHGDLGTSFVTGRPVTADLASRFPGHRRAGRLRPDRRRHLRRARRSAVGRAWGMVRPGGPLRHRRGVAMPQFWVGLMLLWLFSTKLHLAPGPLAGCRWA